MNVRTAAFRDLGQIEELYREATCEPPGGRQLSADRPVPEATLVRIWYAVSKTLSSLLPLSDGQLLYVAEENDTIVGFIQAQALTGRSRAWQVLNLCVRPDAHGHFAAQRLVAHLCNAGMTNGVNRFHVRLPLDHPLVSLFLEEGFVQFATEQILYAEEATGGQQIPSGWRSARRDDIGGLYLLYLRTTPSQVASIEGPSLKAWQAGFAQGWMSRLGRDEVRHHVVERPGIVGWTAIRPASSTRPTVLALMCDGHDAQLREELLDAALAEAAPGSLSCVLRHYDSELIRGLQQRGFAIFGTQLLLVRDLGAKVRVPASEPQTKGMLAPASLAQSVGSSRSAALRVLGRTPPSSRT